MKKILKLFSGLLLALGLAACSNDFTIAEKLLKNDHTHTFATTYTSDATHHWYAATCEHTEEVKDKGEHTFGEWTITTQPTEEAEGSKERECSVCHYKATETIAKLAHTHTFATTYTSDATYHWYAATCGHTTEVKDKAEHSFGDYVSNNNATTEADGTKTRTCSVCDYADTVTDVGSRIQIVATPVFSVASGAVTSGTSVTITCTTEGAKIYYTTDGSTPTASSTEYTAAISVTAAVTIKAIAVKGGMNNSVVASVSYTIKFFGTKAPAVAKAEGDIVFNDGSATPYTDGLNLSNEQKGAAIAVIFKVDGGKALGVGLKHSTGDLAWCTTGAKACDQNIDTIQCPANGEAGNLSFTDDTDGSNNLEQIASFLTDAGLGNDTTDASKYPAFYFARNYKTTATNLGAAYENGWYLPTVAELFDIWNVKATVDAASSLCGGSQFGDSYYWSSSQYANYDVYAYGLDFSNGDWGRGYKDSYDDEYGRYFVCAVRAFN